MSIRIHIKKIFLLSLGIVVAAGLLVLLIAAINKKNHKNCNGVEITINGKDDYLFLNMQEIMSIIETDKNNPFKGKALASFDLNKLELMLKQNVWIKDAELYFNNMGMLRVNIWERKPVARIFTVSGNSFYIDSSGKHLPLSDKISVKLPVYSNFPSEKAVLHGSDSLLLQQIKQINRYLLSDSFWTAQIAQVDITPAYTFEMIPVIGSHIIEFGDGNDYEKKFHRLMMFYQQVATRVGFDKYSVVNVQYNSQVVGTKKGTIGKIDSLQALKNIQKLIDASHQLQGDTVSTMVDNNILTNAAAEPSLAPLTEKQQKKIIKNPSPDSPTSLHAISVKSQPPLPLKNKPVLAKEKPKPKALMSRADKP